MIDKEIIKKYPNDSELGRYIRLMYPELSIVKDTPNNFELGACIRDMVLNKQK
jgi:hypothetical protein